MIEDNKIIEAYKNMRQPQWRKPRYSLNEASLAHVVGKNVEGYCIISACRSDWVEHMLKKIGGIDGDEFKSMSKDEQHKFLDNAYWNNKYTKELASDLRKSDIGYIPMYGGGYNELVDGEKKAVYEKSFMLPCYNKRKEPISFEKVKNTVIELGKKYRQQEVLIAPPNSKPYYYTTTHYENGGEVGDENHNFEKDAKLNDIAQDYFTSLNKVGDYPKSHKDSTVKRFSYVYNDEDSDVNNDVEIAGDAQSLTEAHCRYLSGEIVSYHP
jgi:hypothetical protein